jgi:hypothetical protein
MGRTLRTCLIIAVAALTLVACGGDDDSADPSPSSETITTADDEAATTEGGTTDETDPPDEESGDLCDALQEIADLTAAIDESAGEGDDWPATQEAYADLGPAIVDAYEAAAEAASDDTVVTDLTMLRDLLDRTVDLVASTSTVEEFAAEVSALPGAQEGESASDRLDGYANAECGFSLKG